MEETMEYVREVYGDANSGSGNSLISEKPKENPYYGAEYKGGKETKIFNVISGLGYQRIGYEEHRRAKNYWALILGRHPKYEFERKFLNFDSDGITDADIKVGDFYDIATVYHSGSGYPSPRGVSGLWKVTRIDETGAYALPVTSIEVKRAFVIPPTEEKEVLRKIQLPPENSGSENITREVRYWIFYTDEKGHKIQAPAGSVKAEADRALQFEKTRYPDAYMLSNRQIFKLIEREGKEYEEKMFKPLSSNPMSGSENPKSELHKMEEYDMLMKIQEMLMEKNKVSDTDFLLVKEAKDHYPFSNFYLSFSEKYSDEEQIEYWGRDRFEKGFPIYMRMNMTTGEYWFKSSKSSGSENPVTEEKLRAVWNNARRYARVELMRKARLDENFIESIASYDWGNLREGEKRKVRPAIKQWWRGFTESHERCEWCGAELPPYEEWKYVLCPRCWKSSNPEKSGSGNPDYWMVRVIDTETNIEIATTSYILTEAMADKRVEEYQKLHPTPKYKIIKQKHTTGVIPAFTPLPLSPEESGSRNPLLKKIYQIKKGIKVRPPLLWFRKIREIVKKRYPRFGASRVAKITAGIWHKLSDVAKVGIIRREMIKRRGLGIVGMPNPTYEVAKKMAKRARKKGLRARVIEVRDGDYGVFVDGKRVVSITVPKVKKVKVKKVLVRKKIVRKPRPIRVPIPPKIPPEEPSVLEEMVETPREPSVEEIGGAMVEALRKLIP